MPSLFTLAAPAVLLVPALGMSGAPVDEAKVEEAASNPAQAQTQISDPVKQLRNERVWKQTRIEQRVIIRISPQRSGNGDDILSRLPRQPLNARYVEKKTDKCLAVEDVAGVQTGSGNRLLLFLRNKKIITLNLEKACRARDFYSGFYVEKNKDGKLCVKRDRLHSRNGMKCEVERMRQLVAVTE